MFLIESVATTVLWVLSMAEQMMKASGSSSRAASRTGTRCRSPFRIEWVSYLALLVQIDQADVERLVLRESLAVAEVVVSFRRVAGRGFGDDDRALEARPEEIQDAVQRVHMGRGKLVVVLTMFGLMTTCFLVLSTGRIWSSIATSASQMFLRRLAPFTTETTDRRLSGPMDALGAAAS